MLSRLVPLLLVGRAPRSRVTFSSFSPSQPLQMSAFGYCNTCEEVHSLPTTSEAENAATELRERLEASGRVDFDTPAEVNKIVHPWDVQDLSVSSLLETKIH